MKSDRQYHLPHSTLCRLQAGLLEIEEIQTVLGHLLDCSSCAAAYRELLKEERRQPLQEWETILASWGKEDHLEFEALIPWLDSPLEETPSSRPKARSSLESRSKRQDELHRDVDAAHLLRCPLCRRGLDDLIGFVREERERRRSQNVRYRQPRYSHLTPAKGGPAKGGPAKGEMVSMTFQIRSKGMLWGYGRRWFVFHLLFVGCGALGRVLG
jgi:bacterioferritin-associated ferredoxin